MIKINSAEYIISIAASNQNINKNLPEFLFLGRSNVGKSSLINSLCGRKNLAYTSSKPGKTLYLNYFLINNAFYFVDVPGYGYAKRAYDKRFDFGHMIEDYLHNVSLLKLAFLIVDSLVGPTEDDKLMYDYLLHYDIKTIIVSTKYDKLNQKERSACSTKLKNALDLKNLDNVYFVSSNTKYGIDNLLNLIEENVTTNNSINIK